MRPRLQIPATVLIALVGMASASTLVAQGPRMPSGKPDLSGTYDAATLTPLMRPARFGDKLWLTPEEAEAIAEEERRAMEISNAASDPNREAPPEGGAPPVGGTEEQLTDLGAGNVGGYNGFWIDRGTGALEIDGKFRTSIIIDPKNGQFPPMTPKGMQQMSALISDYTRSNDGTAYWIDEGDEPGPYDNMEQRPIFERCLLGFNGAAPSVPGLYNNFKRIVQTEDSVMILLEMVHDARVVRMDSEHPSPEIRLWLGDSIGWWEGDTLVVDTTNFKHEGGMLGGADAHVVERFTRMENGDLLYKFTVTDESRWRAPITGEYVWRLSDERVYEYACHEGNHALGGVMRGARVLEREAMEEKGKPVTP